MTDVVSLRKLPYPYRAMLAICSDLDETPDRDVYWTSTRFLNTTEQTAMGPGVGLEVGNTIYFDMPRDQFAYWNTDEAGRAMLRALMRSGHVDCLHSFGDLATRRADAGRALDDLVRHDCRLQVWIDHAVAPTNFGEDIMQGTGDVRGAPAYHADLSWEYGVRYVWRGRVTSVIGQDAPRSLRGLLRPGGGTRAARTLSTEAAKGVLGRGLSSKYAMHAANDVLRPAQLRSGQPVVEFMRFNPSPGGVSCDDTSEGLGRVLDDHLLHHLARREAFGILYTHLGKIRDRSRPFGPATCEALRNLRRHQDAGRVLVTTTRRLLGYCAARREVRASVARHEGEMRLNITTGTAEANDLQGLTFYVPDASRATLWIDGRPARHNVNPPDETGASSVSLPWQPLAFPAEVLA